MAGREIPAIFDHRRVSPSYNLNISKYALRIQKIGYKVPTKFWADVQYTLNILSPSKNMQ